jgi:NHL repeat
MRLTCLVILKEGAVGVISRVAGTVGTAGSGGDDGLATSAQLHSPFGVAVTADGGFLIADFGNNKVRKVSAGGVITRVPGTGVAGGAGDDGRLSTRSSTTRSGWR